MERHSVCLTEQNDRLSLFQILAIVGQVIELNIAEHELGGEPEADFTNKRAQFEGHGVNSKWRT